MSTRSCRLFLVTVLALAAAVPAGRAADEYAVDPAHTAVTFKISHLGLSWTHGRFKDVSGTFAVDAANPAGTRFELTAKVESVDTDNAKRDEHLKTPDFFDAKKFPTITFKSAAVKAVEGGYEVKGDITLHGVTKPITVTLAGGRTAEFPKGVVRTGFSCEFMVKRSDFGMDKMVGAVGDNVYLAVSFEGTKK